MDEKHNRGHKSKRHCGAQRVTKKGFKNLPY
jgi:hypothetical protein